MLQKKNHRVDFDEQLRFLYSLGHRPTGSDNHAALVDWIAADLAKLGFDVRPASRLRTVSHKLWAFRVLARQRRSRH